MANTPVKKETLKMLQQDVVKVVENRIDSLSKENKLHFPDNYSADNAMKAAWLKLQEVKDKDGKYALEVCDKNSIANALMDMVVQGLTPVKNQCYFVAFGKQLNLMRSYFGTMAVTKRLKDVKEINPQLIYKGDVFEYELKNGCKRVVKHEQKLENIDKDNIVGAYCTIIMEDGREYTELMTFKQILQAWGMSKTAFDYKNKTKLKADGVHSKFTDQMALKTVINRACKYVINSSDDSDLFIESVNRSTENEYKEVKSEVNELPEEEPKNISFDDEPEEAEIEKPEPKKEEAPKGPAY